MENFQEYRDNLAEKLKGIEDHEERKEALEEEKKTSDYEKAKDEHKKEKNSDYVEEINSLPNALEKIVLITKKTVDSVLTKGIREYDVFDEYDQYFDEKTSSSITEELKSSIQTSEQLDALLSAFMSRVHQFYHSVGVPMEEYKNLDGHVLGKAHIIVNIFPKIFMNKKEHSDEDLDWWYTLAKHLLFSSSIMGNGLIVRIYKSHIDDPRSVKFKEYIESVGVSYLLTD